MGYFIKRIQTAKRLWKLQLVEYPPGKGGKHKTTDIPIEEYSRLGFTLEMSLDEAKARASSLNSDKHLRRIEEKRIAIAKRLSAEDHTLNSYLNKRDVEDFETSVLYATATDRFAANKIESHWRAARRILLEIKIKPEDFGYHKRRFYDAFAKKRYSPSYAQKIIAIINAWGKFYCRKHRLFFEELPFPTRHDKERIADKYFEKRPKGRVSDPITPEMLEKVKSQIKPEWYRWFYLSVWFGLRPPEVDLLTKPTGPRTWMIGKTDNGTYYLAVYQSKLTAIPVDKRTKVIPCIVKEQEVGLRMILDGNIKRPSSSRYVKTYFGENVNLHGGRKGFSELMRSLGQIIEDYTSWLGHQTMERTFKDYKNKQAINFKPVRRLPRQPSRKT